MEGGGQNDRKFEIMPGWARAVAETSQHASTMAAPRVTCQIQSAGTLSELGGKPAVAALPAFRALRATIAAAPFY